MTERRNGVLVNAICFLTVFLFFFWLRAPFLAANAVKKGLNICVTKALPSLFPFLVLNGLILNTGASEFFARLVGKWVSKIFNVPTDSTAAIISGCLFGFPIGARSVCTLRTNGNVTKKDAERLLCFCSNTGPAFVVGAVGGALNSPAVGWVIFFSQLLSAAVIGIAMRREGEYTHVNSPPERPRFTLSAIPAAISDSVFPMMSVCAFIIFFSCISDSVGALLSALRISGYLEVFMTGCLELTGGISLLCPPIDLPTLIFSAFFVGWSGLSVILQTAALCNMAGLSCKRFVKAKAVQGILCSVFSLLICKLLKLY